MPITQHPIEMAPIGAVELDLETSRAVDRLCADLGLSRPSRDAQLAALVPLCREIERRRRQHGRTLVVGVQGAQGSGKTTLCRLAALLLERLHGRRVCAFSIDDLYLTRAERRDLADRVHPLFATRGVPGTHDVALGRDRIERLRRAGTDDTIALPIFDKAIDDRRPAVDWPQHCGPIDIVLFEGWCVGCRPRGDAITLETPINRLEAIEDPDAVWRLAIEEHLATDYGELFAEIDCLLVLQVPGFEYVRRWRQQQEERLAAGRPGAPGLMDASALDRFLMHFERTTRHALDTLPSVADIVCRLGEDHRIVEIESRVSTDR